MDLVQKLASIKKQFFFSGPKAMKEKYLVYLARFD
jgi:hypothetical protein